MKPLTFFFFLIFFSFRMLGQTDTSTEDKVFLVVENFPTFAGGNDEMGKFIGQNVHYPDFEKEHTISGTCYVSFIVEKDGRVSDVKVIRGVTNGSGCDAEAVRVVKLMPNWTPGMQNGRAVRTRFNLPIKFTLRDPK